MAIAAAKQQETTESKAPVTVVEAKPTAPLATASATPHAVTYFEQGVHHNNGYHHPTHHVAGHGKSNAAYWEHYNNHVAPFRTHGSGAYHGDHGAHGHGHYDNHLYGHGGHSWPYGHHLTAPHAAHMFHTPTHRHSRSGYEVNLPNFVQWNHRY